MTAPKKDGAAIIDTLIEKVDPEVLLAAALGGVAARGGIVPPVTRMLMALSSNTGTISDDFLSVLARAGPTSPALGIGNPPTVLLGMIFSNDQTTIDPAGYALLASGAMEAMIVMSLVKNPAFVSGAMHLLESAASSGAGLAKALAVMA